jgi:hypothetical protein
MALSHVRDIRALSIGVVVVATAVALPIGSMPASSADSPVDAGVVASSNVPIPSSGLIFGAMVSAEPGQKNSTAASAFENQLGRTLGMDRSYSRWDDPQPNYAIQYAVKAGRIPFVSIQPQRSDGSPVSWASIASGSEDATVRAQADALKAVARPIMVSLDHEMNLTTAYGTPADYRAAAQHFVTVFRAEGAANVSFAFVLSAAGYQDGQAADYYPGASYVDWIGADAYNFGGCQPGLPAWRSLADTAGAFYQWGSAQGKPLVLAEWGTAQDPNDPKRQARWIDDAAATMQSWPNLKAAAYFDSDNYTCPWRVTDNADTLASFRTLARSAPANGLPTAHLTIFAGGTTTTGSVTFKENNSTGANQSTGNGIASWTIDFGDGTPTTSGSGQPSYSSHLYTTNTPHSATLRILDSAGGQATTTQTVPQPT